jgi:hypothetical protein
MTAEQKFFFDLRGWIVLPAVLSPSEIHTLRAECYAGTDLTAHRGGALKDGYLGNLEVLLDHPAVVGILTELLSDAAVASEGGYGFRCENTHVIFRPTGWSKSERGDDGLPHVVLPPQQANAMRYQVAGGKIYSGLTRVLWELEEVKAGQGGTAFLSGSHKAHFGYGGPDRWEPNIGGSPWAGKIRARMDEYSCPAGSAIIFTESLVHAANDWTNPDNPRCVVFNLYNSLWANWCRTNVPPQTILAMPAKRQTLFRGVWQQGQEANVAYAADNSTVFMPPE